MALPTLLELSADETDAVVGHPAQMATVIAISELLEQLRSCVVPSDYDSFQRELFGHIYDVEERHGAIRRVLKRLARGEALPANAPDLGNGRPHQDRESWRLEDLAYVRIGRQLRAVGDALAWQVCGFNRALISTLSRSAATGHVFGQEGLPWELGAVEAAFRERGNFMLLHDLTTCLRIGDATEFTAEGGALIHEVKKSGRRAASQQARMQAAVDAVMHDGPLPGDRDARLIHLETRLANHISTLADAVRLATTRGTVGAVVPRGGRALLVADYSRMMTQPDRDWIGEWFGGRARLYRRLGLRPGTHEVVSRSLDQAARHPDIVPFGNFPIAANEASRLICDLLAYEVHMPVDAIVAAAERAGLEAETSFRRENDVIERDAGVFQFRRGTQGIIVHGHAVDRLLLEFVNVDTWARGLAEVLDRSVPGEEPVLIYRDEARQWVL